MKKVFLVLILMIAFLSFANAESYVFKQGDVFTLDTIMANADFTPCTLCTCTYTIYYPNGSVIVRDTPGVNVGGYCRYENNLWGLGIYGGEIYFTDSVNSGRSTFEFEITTTGKSSNSKVPIFLLISGLVLLVLGFLFESPPIGFFSGVLFMLVGTFLMIYGFENIADLYTRGFALITIGFGMTISFLAGYSWLDE